MLQSLPPNSGLGAMVADRFIEMLYNDLPHPATTLAGPEAKYRRHDGGANNPWVPEMGKAGSPYSRNVPPTKPKGPNLPDPELVYEQLMKRKGPFREHPSGLNRMVSLSCHSICARSWREFCLAIHQSALRPPVFLFSLDDAY